MRGTVFILENKFMFQFILIQYFSLPLEDHHFPQTVFHYFYQSQLFARENPCSSFLWLQKTHVSSFAFPSFQQLTDNQNTTILKGKYYKKYSHFEHDALSKPPATFSIHSTSCANHPSVQYVCLMCLACLSVTQQPSWFTKSTLILSQYCYQILVFCICEIWIVSSLFFKISARRKMPFITYLKYQVLNKELLFTVCCFKQRDSRVKSPHR